jgi:hypothetical protein
MLYYDECWHYLDTAFYLIPGKLKTIAEALAKPAALNARVSWSAEASLVSSTIAGDLSSFRSRSPAF